ncbi:hypothetical protein pf16_215 [Pseudomonas phage pf16]|uniref:Probable pectate lyase C n=1 Tax=Pseudomonas phage pf16 TaxID=1815630 RepID=A0A1S5R3Z4_9CAUD|nr:tail fiber protein [Pseudomonas phage pf16]AND75138.1 hypothetical protein pf16_215 [Pseudomonas phage pf16]
MSITRTNTLADVNGNNSINVSELASKVVMSAPEGASKIGYGNRTQEQKNGDVLSVRDYITTAVNGVTSNQAGIVAAVAAAKSSGASLHWPAGTYVSTASIPDFHSVRHTGPGVVKRGTNLFSISQFDSAMNTLFVSTSGLTTNDGLSSTEAMLSPNAAVNLWGAKYAATACGPWKIKIAAGTYFESIIAQGYQSNKEIFLEGEYDAVNQVPLTIMDGSVGATNSGIIFTTYGWVNCKWILCQNFTTVGAGGFNIGNYGRMTIDTCHAYNNNLVGFSAAQAADLRIIGRCYIKPSANGTGVTYYRQCTGSWSDATGEIIIDGFNNAATTGVLVRDNSYVVAGCKLTVRNCTSQAVWLRRHSYLEVRDYEITNNNIAFDLRDLSLLAPNGGTQVLTGNTQDYAYKNFSLPWDTASNMAIGADGPSVQAPSAGNYALVVSGKSQVGQQFLTDASTSTINIDFNKKGSLVYAQTDNTLRIALNSADAYRFAASVFYPTVDNAKTLGGSSFRWSTIYAGTSTINTSDETAKQQIKPIDDACLRAWANVEYVQYKFNDAVEAKGDGARWHFGLIAQRVKKAFEDEGLNAFDYGLLCYDEWDEQPEEVDEEGNIIQAYLAAGSRYGIRYEEALALECAYLRSLLKK